MRLNALPEASLVPLVISCLTLSCHANLQPHQHEDALRAPRAKIDLGSSHRELGERREITLMSARGGNCAGAFLSPASPSVRHARQNSANLPSVAQQAHVNHRYSTPPLGNSPFLGHKRSSPRMPFLHSLTASNDDTVQEEDIIENGDEGQQRGMDEAFASLEALSPEDFHDNSYDGDDVPNLKHSPTDDTPASDLGKSTKEEVEHYLEIQGELEGSARSSSQEEADQNVVENNLRELEIDEMMTEANEDQDLLSSNNSEEYPWTSINPILRVRGPVASGYGRGGKKLGVPTANLPASLFQSALEDVTNGVYFGWAVVEQPPISNNDSSVKRGRNTPIKAVVNVGYSPTFEGKENKEKIVEAHLITRSSPMEKADRSGDGGEAQFDDAGDEDVEIDEDFYNETMRLQLIGYLRPEQKFGSFPDLIAQIHRDIGNAHWALDTMPFIFSKEDEFVKDGMGWIGSGGGDMVASWEYESW